MTVRGRSVKWASGLAAVMLWLAAAAAVARADAPTLRVTNLGQGTAPVEVGQPPIDIVATAGCAHPFTVANEAGCPPGTWPPLGQQWGQVEDVAGGDTLRLELSAPVTSVSVGSTSNYAPGLHDPDGRAIPNYDVVSESAAQPTSDPGVWLTTLPPLDYRAISTIGYTFSVVALDGSGYHDYPFGIRAPRYANELTKCGTAYFSTGVSQSLCGGAGGKGPPPRHGPRLSAASYDGRIVILEAQVPGPGKLLIGVPTACGGGRPHCHRMTWIARRAARQGRILIRKALALRLGDDRRLTVPVRFSTPGGEPTIVTSRVRVRLVRSS
jgi:hypothetical protein